MVKLFPWETEGRSERRATDKAHNFPTTPSNCTDSSNRPVYLGRNVFLFKPLSSISLFERLSPREHINMDSNKESYSQENDTN